MADDPTENLRLALMQDVLPVGMAMVERARKGGMPKLAEVFTDCDNPLEVLREEGETSAQTLREQLDRVSPGLGNPVVSVKVDVDETNVEVNQMLDQESLIKVLDRIQSGMEELEQRLFNDSSDDSTITIDEG